MEETFLFPWTLIGALMPDQKLEGGCQCGAVRYRVLRKSGDGRTLPLHHVPASQCGAGSGWAMYETLPGLVSHYATRNLRITRRGQSAVSALTAARRSASRPSTFQGLIDLTIGSLDEPSLVPPTFSLLGVQALALAPRRRPVAWLS